MRSKSLKCVLLTLAASGFVSVLQAGLIDAIEAFGDSLSDVGNVSFLSGGTIPGAPYAPGQFSNGNVWVQDLALALGVGPLTPSLLGGTDYAYGSAQSGITLYNPVGSNFDLTTTGGQISQFATANSGVADPNALYTIWIGANDLNAIPAGASNAQIGADLGFITANIESAIGTLAGMGAKNFLVVDVPDLGKTPDAIALGPLGVAAASEVSGALDGLLVPSLATIAAGDGIDINVLDSYGLLDEITSDPSAFGLTDVTDPCLTGESNFVGGTSCATPNTYLFWDGDHPTAAGHAIIADAAFDVITPEPASAVLSGIGIFGLFLLRRRYRGGGL